MSNYYKKISISLLMLILYITTAIAQQTVTGRVTDANGGLPGVTITVVGTNKATQSNTNGSFTIQANNGENLRFSIIGYVTKEVTVSGTTVNVTLEEDASGIDEVVVTAMGIKREERKIGYGVSTVKGEDIVKTSPTNLVSALYGKATGVGVNSNPGGATSAVSMDIRGLNSMSNPRQPLLVVDGVISRNGEANNNGYWSSPRIEGNGILDIHPENIESISILKGAAATALYGSEAGAGAIIITTKSGKGAKGIGIDVNTSYGLENVAIIPEYQSVFGQGWDRVTNQQTTGNDEGWVTINVDGKDYQRPWANQWAHFGPRYDGRDIYYFDGTIRKYEPYTNNWKNFYKTGFSAVNNIAVYNANEKLNYRFSYSRNDYSGVMEGGDQGKNTFNLNSSVNITPKLKFDLVANYMNEKVDNRPWQIDRITNNYAGFLSPTIDMNTLRNLYKTSEGYKYVTFGNRVRNPEEAFKYNINGGDILDYFWTQLERSFIENTNRIMASGTVTYNILDNLSFRGRLGTDYTGYQNENKEPNEFNNAFGRSGYYSTAFNRYNYTYGDLLLSYSQDLSQNIKLNAQLGYQATRKEMRYSSQNTDGGLAQENWFSFNNSNNNPRGWSNRGFETKDGIFAILGFDINDNLFIEGSVRQERTSTLAPGNNVFYYPSVSAAYELSNAFKMPDFFSYSKLRASYGEVGNPPGNYSANEVFNTTVVNGALSYYLTGSAGNNLLKNERKKEFEIGWENRFLNGRAGLEITYYNNKIVDQINRLSVPSSMGASNILYNVGTMQNQGLELGLSGTPIKTNDFTWNTKLNIAFNKNKILELNEALNLTELQHSSIDNGSIIIKSTPGSSAYDIYSYVLTQHSSGELLVGSDGYYVPDFTSQDALKKLGNLQPKSIGGFINDFSYKNLALNVVVDYKWGAQVHSNSLQFAKSGGLLEETLFGRDAEHGGIAYYVDSNGNAVKAPEGSTSGPGGEKIYYDGMIMQGVLADGTPNTKIIDAANYYVNTYYWGAYPGSGLTGTYASAIYDNNYIKMREMALTYNLPSSLANKIKANNLSLTAFGRNLFYFYKSLPHLDPEAGVGTNYLSRAAVGGSGAAARSYGLTLRLTF